MVESPPRDLVTAYEALRGAVVAGPPVTALGLGVVLRSGVGAWMEVCGTTSPDRGSSPSCEPVSGRPADRGHREFVAIWAQMAAPVYEEARHG